jgi:cation diffusion facilitator family transporter
VIIFWFPAMLYHPDTDQNHLHGHNPGQDVHNHTHDAIDPSSFTSQRGIWAIKWSFIGLTATAAFQLIIVILSGSVALLADTIHNFGDAATAIPLWISFRLATWKPNKRFTYGYGRVEDLAGVVIVFTILLTAIVAGYESINRFYHPQSVKYLWAVIVAAVIGIIGNEAVAQFRIKVGTEIGSAVLVADGQHARVDGLTSLAVLFGALGVCLGYPLLDPVVGLLITVVIMRILWQSGKSIFTRLLDGVEPEVVDDIRHTVDHAPGVKDISEIRVRWLGHRLYAELNIAVNPEISVEKGHEIAKAVRYQLLHHLRYLANATIHIDPVNASGEKHHRLTEPAHGDLPAHSH